MCAKADVGAYSGAHSGPQAAIEQYPKTLDLDPNFAWVHGFLGLAYLQKFMYKEGIAECGKELVVSPGNPYALSGLGYAYAVAGRRAEARKVLDRQTHSRSSVFACTRSRDFH